MRGARMSSGGGLRREISRIKKLVRQGKVPVNDFIGLLVDQADFPSIAGEVLSQMPYGYKLFDGDVDAEPMIPQGCIEIQKWTHGVSPHHDLVDEGVYFMVYCLDTKEVSRESSCGRQYVCETILYGPNYTEVVNMEPGSVGVFNPRETHCLIHSGLDVLIAIVSVEKVNEVLDGKEKE